MTLVGVLALLDACFLLQMVLRAWLLALVRLVGLSSKLVALCMKLPPLSSVTCLIDLSVVPWDTMVPCCMPGPLLRSSVLIRVLARLLWQVVVLCICRSLLQSSLLNLLLAGAGDPGSDYVSTCMF